MKPISASTSIFSFILMVATTMPSLILATRHRTIYSRELEEQQQKKHQPRNGRLLRLRGGAASSSQDPITAPESWLLEDAPEVDRDRHIMENNRISRSRYTIHRNLGMMKNQDEDDGDDDDGGQRDGQRDDDPRGGIIGGDEGSDAVENTPTNSISSGLIQHWCRNLPGGVRPLNGAVCEPPAEILTGLTPSYHLACFFDRRDCSNMRFDATMYVCQYDANTESRTWLYKETGFCEAYYDTYLGLEIPEHEKSGAAILALSTGGLTASALASCPADEPEVASPCTVNPSFLCDYVAVSEEGELEMCSDGTYGTLQYTCTDGYWKLDDENPCPF